MLRVLMVLEDYGELMYLQTVLKKLGFDVEAIQNPRALADSLLRINPDLVVMTAFGKRVPGYELYKNLAKQKSLPKAIMLFSLGQQKIEDPDIEAWLESPISVNEFLSLVAKLTAQNAQALLDKFQKLKLQDPRDESGVRVLKSPTEEDGPQLKKSNHDVGHFGELQPSTLNEEDRQERFQRFLSDPPPKNHGYALKQVHEHVKDLRQQEKQADNEGLEKERKAFVEHLFKREDN